MMGLNLGGDGGERPRKRDEIMECGERISVWVWTAYGTSGAIMRWVREAYTYGDT